MRAAVPVIAVLLASCSPPTPGEEAMAELTVSMRAQSEMVRRGVGLQEIFEGQCTADCSGHRAGYLWALERPSVTEDDCQPGEQGESFAAGCRMGVVAASFE